MMDDFTYQNRVLRSRGAYKYDIEYIGQLVHQIPIPKGQNPEAPDVVRDRAENLMLWYSLQATKCKRTYYFCTMFTVGLPLMVTVFNTTATVLSFVDHWLSIFISLFSALSCLLSTFLSVTKCQENWVRYRRNAERLKSETFRYVSGAEPYDDDDDFTKLRKIYANRMENIVMEEDASWENMRKSDINKPSIPQKIH